MIETTIRKITGKISAIERREINPDESGLGYLFNYLKDFDEAAYLKLIERYKTVLNKIKSEKS